MRAIRKLVLVIALMGLAVESADGFFLRWRLRRMYWSNYYSTWNYSSYYGWGNSCCYYPSWGYTTSYYVPSWSGPVYYYYPSITHQVPQYATAPQVAVVSAPTKYAKPVAAPPSTKKEPPLAEKRKPKITESRFPPKKKNDADDNTVKTNSQSSLCRVGFWNVTGTNITLTVNGQAHYIERNKAVTVMVTPDFAYQVNDRTTQHVSVPSQKSSWEIVIR